MKSSKIKSISNQVNLKSIQIEQSINQNQNKIKSIKFKYLTKEKNGFVIQCFQLIIKNNILINIIIKNYQCNIKKNSLIAMHDSINFYTVI